jgi:hypothetical protein
MDNRERFPNLDPPYFLLEQRGATIFAARASYTEDKRVSRLLLLLNEIDQAIALEEVPQPRLVELVSGAIMECGFVDQAEARYAIAAVLKNIEEYDGSSIAS